MESESSRSSSSSSSPAVGNCAGESYLGSFVSLISNYGVRYEGFIYHLDIRDSTLGLKNVRSYGTEGREKDGPQVPPSDKVFEYILFRGSDVKDLQVKAPPPMQLKQGILSDEEIIQLQCSGAVMSSSLSCSGGGYSSARTTQQMDTPAVSSKIFPATQHSPLPLSFSPSSLVGGRSLAESPRNISGPSNTSHAAPGTGGASVFTQGNKEAMAAISLALSEAVSPPTTVHNHPQRINFESYPIVGVVNDNSHLVAHVSALGNNPLYSNFSPLPQAQLSASDGLLSFPIQNSQPLDPWIAGKSVYKTPSNCSKQPMPRELSVVAPASGPVNLGQLSLGTDQLLQSRRQASHLMQMAHGGQDAMVAVQEPMSLDMLSQRSVPVNQAPLLPPPVSVQQSLHLGSSMQFTEEFDFEAMNQKFNKDEVWGYLGKSKQMYGIDTGEEIMIEPCLEGNAKPAYRREDFFDTISCNSLSHGARSGRKHIPERMNLDTETYGNFQRSPQLQPGYGEYAAAHPNHRGGYNLGTGYSYYGRRTHGRGTHF